MRIIIDMLGWIASVLIVGAYFLNIRGRWSAQSKWYIICNLVGGAFFIVNTAYHGAYPSALVNVVWVVIAIFSIMRWRRKGPNADNGR
jgi:hypothetical protein